eukprot:scaffold63644_cov20-Tisochrysis_lutea.AAC.3
MHLASKHILLVRLAGPAQSLTFTNQRVLMPVEHPTSTMLSLMAEVMPERSLNCASYTQSKEKGIKSVHMLDA